MKWQLEITVPEHWEPDKVKVTERRIRNEVRQFAQDLQHTIAMFYDGEVGFRLEEMIT